MRLIPVVILLLIRLASAQKAVDMSQDAHYSLLLQNKLIRVFKLSLNANDELQSLHNRNFVNVALDDCDLAEWREGGSEFQSYHANQGDVRFFFAGQPISTRNNRSDVCRSIVIEFVDPKVTTDGYQWWDNGKWENGSTIAEWPKQNTNPSLKSQSILRLGSAIAIQVQIPPGDVFSAPRGSTGELLIPIGGVDLERSKAIIHKSPGEAVFTTTDQKIDMLNAGTDAARLVAIEVLGDRLIR